jgi:hypothetical protein
MEKCLIMDFGSKLKSQIPVEFGKAGVSGVEGMKAMNDFTREIKEEEYYRDISRIQFTILIPVE